MDTRCVLYNSCLCLVVQFSISRVVLDCGHFYFEDLLIFGLVLALDHDLHAVLIRLICVFRWCCYQLLIHFGKIAIPQIVLY